MYWGVPKAVVLRFVLVNTTATLVLAAILPSPLFAFSPSKRFRFFCGCQPSHEFVWSDPRYREGWQHQHYLAGVRGAFSPLT